MPHNDQACPAILCRRLSRHLSISTRPPPRSGQQAERGKAGHSTYLLHLSPGGANIEMYVSMLEIWSGSIYQDNTSIYFYIRYLSIDIYYLQLPTHILYYFDNESTRYSTYNQSTYNLETFSHSRHLMINGYLEKMMVDDLLILFKTSIF